MLASDRLDSDIVQNQSYHSCKERKKQTKKARKKKKKKSVELENIWHCVPIYILIIKQ